MRFKCTTCGRIHEKLPDISFDAPYYYYTVPEKEREQRTFLNRDLCVIDEDFFVKGCLEVPIEGSDDVFAWGVWVSLSRTNYERYVDLFDGDPPAGEGPYSGWLSNRIPEYPDTLSLKALVHLRRGGRRPSVELEPTEHPLAVHQRQAITLDDLLLMIGDRLHQDPETLDEGIERV